MNNTNLSCSLNDTTILRNLILENPDLPLLIFVGEEAWSGEYGYEQADVVRGEIQELSLYNDEVWMDYDDYEDRLTDDLSYEEEYENLSDDEYEKMIDEKMKEVEFVKAIVIYVG